MPAACPIVTVVARGKKQHLLKGYHKDNFIRRAEILRDLFDVSQKQTKYTFMLNFYRPLAIFDAVCG